MKKVLFFILISYSLPFYADDHNLTKPYFNHLSEINIEWLHHKEACPIGSVSFSSDIDRIQLHLNLAIRHLRTNRPSNLNSEQLSNRTFLLKKLQQYADNKVFPVNKYHLTRQPYFVDDFGTNCAVGQMIYHSGYEDLVVKISKEHNYDYIEDINTEGIQEWANEFGFTIEELKWIQPGYNPTATIEQVLDGTNGSINKIELNPFGLDPGLVIAGDFTQLDNLPCLNIGIYQNNQLSCLGSGVDGIINDVIYHINLAGDIYAFGELHHNGKVYPMAKYDGSIWSYLGIPNRDSAICTSANLGGTGYQFEISIGHNSFPQHQEIWHYLNDNTWEKQAKVKGIILDIIASNYGSVHTGHFDSVIVYNSNSTIDTTFTVNNVLISTNFTNLWHGIGSDISDTVNVVIDVGGALIFGGTCGNQSGASNVCLSRYFNSVLQPLLLNDSGIENYSVNTIAYESGNEFTFGGNFEIQPFIGTYGSNLATYNLVNNSVEAIASLDQPVNSLLFWGSDLYIGGSFQTNLVSNNVNFLGRILSTVGINESFSEINLNVYPNPTNGSINIDIEETKQNINLCLKNAIGQVVLTKKYKSTNFINIDIDAPSGIYTLQLETSNGELITRKIIKE